MRGDICILPLEGMKVFEIPASEWAKFKCIGTMPQALQTVNTRIFSEWLPGNQDFEMTFPINPLSGAGIPLFDEAVPEDAWEIRRESGRKPL